ncbi:MAG: metal-dependent transcriptional regulator [Sphingobacteriaceae bacterium]|nr:metal-dependent transcriptional regulator [Sphingobacteriaceae bacterium]
MRSETIENYLKTIYNLTGGSSQVVSNQQLAAKLGINPASVTESLKKLHELKYVIYEKSYGTRLTASGAKLAVGIVRRHRIWETYLHNVLGFGWEEVHEIAEELEHVSNDKLIQKLANILGNPGFDPHGDPIPDEKGKVKRTKFIPLSQAKAGKKYIVRAVSDHSTLFLNYLKKHGLIIGAEFDVSFLEDYDGSMLIMNKKKEIVISASAADSIIVSEKG